MIKCNKCGVKKDDSNFPIQRRGKLYESMAGYCRECRKYQMYSNLNTSVDKFLIDRHNRLKIRAKSKGIICSITRDEFVKLYHNQKGKCFYTGVEMTWGVGKGFSRDSISIDKMIPKLGYTKENTVLCSNKVNTVKCDLSLEELKQWIPKWYKKIVKSFPQK